MAGEEGAQWLAELAGSKFGTTPMVIRTRYFDDFLKDAVWERGIRQVVILAAGMDTRAFRLDWPTGTHLFELDQPSVLQYKEQMLTSAGDQPNCQRFAVTKNLTEDWIDSLVVKGFDQHQPTVWLLEGFLFYLSNEQITPILKQVSCLSAPASRLGFDIINQQMLISPITKAWVEMQALKGAPWIGWLDDPQAFLGECNWQITLTQPGAPDANFGRWLLPVIPLEARNLPHNWYVTATMNELRSGG